MDPVLTVTIPGVLEDLTVLGNIGDKQRRYRQRLIDGGAGNGDDVIAGPLYLLSEAGTVSVRDDVFGGGLSFLKIEFASGQDCKKGKRALPAFFEMRYIFRAKCSEKVKNVRVYHRLEAVTDGFTFAGGWLFGDIDFINTPGRFTLSLDVDFTDGSSRRINFQFTVVSVKMDVEGDYKKILNVIERERPGLVQNFLAKTFGDAGFDPKGDTGRPTWYAILESIFDFYTDACKQIIHNPHRRYERVAEWRHPDQIKRWTPALANRFAALPEDRQESAWFRVDRIEAEIDTQENRFVLHTLRDISRQLREFANEYKVGGGISRICLEGIEAQADELDRLADNPFFRGVGRYKGGAAQSLVLQKRAGYAQILTAWLTLKQALSPEGKGLDVGYRPLSALYEFWTFLSTRDILTKLLEAEGFERTEDPHIEDLAHLLDSDEESSSAGAKTLCRMGYRFTYDDRSVLLAYQQTYGTDDTGENFAITYEQRPDIVLSIHEGEDVYTYLFDSKYRVDELGGQDASPRDAIDDMHRYRDAILYRRQQAGFSHEIIGAFVLFPGRLGGHSYDYGTMREKENIGAFPLLPGHVDEYEKFLAGLLAKGTKKEHLSVSMPPRGAEISLEPVVDEDEIVDAYWDVEKVEKVLAVAYKEKCYPVENSLFKGREPMTIKRIRIVSPMGSQFTVEVDQGRSKYDPVLGRELRGVWGNLFAGDDRNYWLLTAKATVAAPHEASDTM